ncbi:hypothetical protein ABT324_31250 [Saccharopolyspora sp. NPDC000359]|uniref:hypothetical protein n=1 Tax=Saccharopolyspora sp. NPDC000359 TaxID=3154251 RepID=UPI0033277075
MNAVPGPRSRGAVPVRPPAGYRVYRWVLVAVFAIALLISAATLLDWFITAFTSP